MEIETLVKKDLCSDCVMRYEWYQRDLCVLKLVGTK